MTRERDQGRGFLMIPDHDHSLRDRLAVEAQRHGIATSMAARKMIEHALRYSMFANILGEPVSPIDNSGTCAHHAGKED